MAERTGFVQFLRTLRKLHLSFSFLERYGRSFASILRVHVKPHWGFFFTHPSEDMAGALASPSLWQLGLQQGIAVLNWI